MVHLKPCLIFLAGAGLAAQVPDRRADADLVLPDAGGPLPSLGALPQQRPRRRRHTVHQLLAQHTGPRGEQLHRCTTYGMTYQVGKQGWVFHA